MSKISQTNVTPERKARSTRMLQVSSETLSVRVVEPLVIEPSELDLILVCLVKN